MLTEDEISRLIELDKARDRLLSELAAEVGLLSQSRYHVLARLWLEFDIAGAAVTDDTRRKVYQGLLPDSR